jgi:hypothetical protein
MGRKSASLTRFAANSSKASLPTSGEPAERDQGPAGVRARRGLLGESDPFHAVTGALAGGRFDDVIISTLPARVSHWLHVDLPARVQRLGIPVTVVTAKHAERALFPLADHPSTYIGNSRGSGRLFTGSDCLRRICW